MGGRERRREIRSGAGCLEAAAWATLYQRYYPRIRSRLAARGVHQQDADDLAADLFAKLAQKGRPDDLSTYLATAVANESLGYRRRRARQHDLQQGLLEETAREDRMRRYKAQEWFEDAESGGARDRVDRILSTLPRKEAELLKLRFLEGLPMAKVARRLGCSEVVARKRLQRVIQRLRDRYGVEPPAPENKENPKNSQRRKSFLLGALRIQKVPPPLLHAIFLSNFALFETLYI
jgi:RNA polymerase sigma factor (sigma-70 family)